MSGSAKRLSLRQARLALFFDRFDFTLSYRPGSKNVKPDTLSRQFERPGEETPADAILSEGVVVGALSWEVERRRPDEGWKCQLSVLRVGCRCRRRCALRSFNGVMNLGLPAIEESGGRWLPSASDFGGPLLARTSGSLYWLALFVPRTRSLTIPLLVYSNPCPSPLVSGHT